MLSLHVPHVTSLSEKLQLERNQSPVVWCSSDDSDPRYPACGPFNVANISKHFMSFFSANEDGEISSSLRPREFGERIDRISIVFLFPSFRRSPGPRSDRVSSA